jgi:hypothetical protein
MLAAAAVLLLQVAAASAGAAAAADAPFAAAAAAAVVVVASRVLAGVPLAAAFLQVEPWGVPCALLLAAPQGLPAAC